MSETITWIPVPLPAWKKTKKPHKYGAKTTLIDGIAFSSALEGAVYSILKIREKAGELSEIKLQTCVRLIEKCSECGREAMDFKVDFSATLPNGKTLFVEAKGVRTNSYIQREKAWKTKGPGVLEVWGGAWRSPKLLKTIDPNKPKGGKCGNSGKNRKVRKGT